MSLEMLPDELLLYICSYVSHFDIVQAFNDLNTRLNYTTAKYRNHIDLTQVRYAQFNRYCDMLVHSTLGLQVRSLKLSNTQQVAQQIALFAEQVWPLNEKLPNLECLTFIDATDDDLDLYIPQTKLLKKFIKLNVESVERNPCGRYEALFVRKPTILGTIEQKILRELNGELITSLIGDVSRLYIGADYYDDDDTGDHPTEFPTLVLPDHIFYVLRDLEVVGEDFIFHNELLESFLQQLFQRAPNLSSITISSTGDGNGPSDIDFVLGCLEKPSMSIKHCCVNVKGHYDDLVMESIFFRLPHLTSLTIAIIYWVEDLIEIVNSCLTDFKHIIYLELGEPRHSLWGSYQTSADKNVKEPDRYLWLKENTMLGDSIKGKPFFADFYLSWKIWL